MHYGVNSSETDYIRDRLISLSVCFTDMMNGKDYWAGTYGNLYNELKSFCESDKYFPGNSRVLGMVLNMPEFKRLMEVSFINYQREKPDKDTYLIVWRDGMQEQAMEEYLNKLAEFKAARSKRSYNKRDKGVVKQKPVDAQESSPIVVNNTAEVPYMKNVAGVIIHNMAPVESPDITVETPVVETPIAVKETPVCEVKVSENGTAGNAPISVSIQINTHKGDSISIQVLVDGNGHISVG